MSSLFSRYRRFTAVLLNIASLLAVAPRIFGASRKRLQSMFFFIETRIIYYQQFELTQKKPVSEFILLIKTFAAPSILENLSRSRDRFRLCGWYRRLRCTHKYKEPRSRLKSKNFLSLKKFSWVVI
jgi:hypothetical protein